MTLEDRLGDRAREAALAVLSQYPHELVEIDAPEILRRRLTMRRVHAHIERSVGAERETSRRVIELMRRDSEVHEHAYDGLESDEISIFGHHVT